MRGLYEFVIGNPQVFLPVAIALFVGYNIYHGPIAELLGVCSGLILGTLAHRHWLTAHIEHERREERSTTIKQMLELRTMGLVSVTASRDEPGAGFFTRVRQAAPRTHIALVGITQRFLPVEKPDQLRELLSQNKKLTIQVCVLDPESPCATARGAEVDRPTQRNIHESLTAWFALAAEWPERIVIRRSTATPYVEVEAYDLDLEKADAPKSACLYLTPVGYKAETNVTPSFLINGHESRLFTFWASRMRALWGDAHPADAAAAAPRKERGRPDA